LDTSYREKLKPSEVKNRRVPTFVSSFLY